MLRAGLAPSEHERAGSDLYRLAEAKAHLTWKFPARMQPMTAQFIYILTGATYYTVVSVPFGCQSPATVQLHLLRELRTRSARD
jgi:hypothetical protein